MAQEEERKRKYGDVKPVLSIEFQGHRFVAVGGTLLYDKNWKTFPDFLFAYIKHALGSGWGQNELAKPLMQRHEIMRWFAHLGDVQKGQEPNADGLCSMARDGICSAYLLLAYDLYILRNHGGLQKEVLRRLRLADQFRGARYELFVAATFIRAGFDIDYEDESDTSRKHPEFNAKHKTTSFGFAVEAKAKHRPASPDSASDDGTERLRPRVGGLLRNAAKKKGYDPLVVFVELGLPPEDATKPPSWIAEVQQELEAVIQDNSERSPFDLIVFTNVPNLYGAPGESDPARHFYAIWPRDSAIPESLINAIGNAMMQYGNVPNEFPQDSTQIAV